MSGTSSGEVEHGSASGQGSDGGGVAYWEQRARALGERAVLSTDHVDPLDDVTGGHLELLLGPFTDQLDACGIERPCTVLDLGCGSGRLTHRLAEVAGRAIGVDPVASLLAMAPEADAVDYRLLADPSGPLPLDDGEADALFTCLVLGGLDDAALEALGRELHRVLRPGAAVLLAESMVSDLPRSAHWQQRRPADYAAQFAWADLSEAGRFDDAGDEVGILVGRRRD